MPATTPAPVKSKAVENGKFRYAKCDLTPEQKGSLKYWKEQDADPGELLLWVDKCVASGHTVSVKSQEVNYVASVTGVRDASGHKDISLSAFGSSPANALFALWYKDEVVLKGVWVAVDRTADVDL
jgi:hypothetical protein